MRARVFVLAFCLLVAWASPAGAEATRWGRMYAITGSVSVRENPSDDALRVRVLKSGQKVRADFQEDGWVAVFEPGETRRSEVRAMGYALLAELKANGRPEGPAPVQSEERPAQSEKAEKSAKPEKSEKSEKPEKPEKRAKQPQGAKPKQEPKKKAEAFGEVRAADRDLTVRAARDKESSFVRLLKAGTRVRVDFLENGWYAVFDPGEKVRELSRAWGYSREKYLVPEDQAPQPPQPLPSEAARIEAARPAAQAKQAPKGKAQEDDAVGYAVLERKDDAVRGVSVLRVRIENTAPPKPDTLRQVAREIWKAERKKHEDLQLEILLTGMDKDGLAYAVARFFDDGRLKEFWWRDVVLGKKK